MKKKMKLCLFPQEKGVRKILLIMRLSMILTLVSILNLSASVFSQKKVDLVMKQVSLKQVFDEIEKQTGLSIIYSNSELDQNKVVNFVAHNVEVVEAVSDLLKNNKLTCRLAGDYIIVKPQQQNPFFEIKGIVVDQKGMPLPGVTIKLLNEAKGAASDINGKFTLITKLKEGTLVVSFIGMKTQNVKFKAGKFLNIKMKISEEKIGEVVVTGFSKIKKESFTGNAVIVTKEKLKRINTKNVISALSTFDPSFVLNENSDFGSDPNSLPEFSLRGGTSIPMGNGMDIQKMRQEQRTNLEGNPNLPMFVVDGFQVSVQTIVDMDMERVESISILKDAAATAVYGSRAANGVIVIVTRAPQPGELRISYNLKSEVKLPDLRYFNLCNAREKLEAERLSGLYTDSDNSNMQSWFDREYNNKLLNIQRGIDTDWLAQPLRTAYDNTHSIYIEGGVESIRYGIDLNYNGGNAVMKGAFRQKMGAGIKIDYHWKGLRIKNHFSYNNAKSQNSTYGNFSDYYSMQPYLPIYDDDGKMIQAYDEFGSHKNPLYDNKLGSYDGKRNRNEYKNNLSLDYTIVEGLYLRGSASVTKVINSDESFKDPLEKEYDFSPSNEKGLLTEGYGESDSWEVKVNVAYNKKIGKHDINSSIGITTSESNYYNKQAKFQGFQIGGLTSSEYAAQVLEKPTFSESTSKLAGTYATVNYSYNNIYLADATIKIDGSSKFGSEHKISKPFWSSGLGVNIHNLEFMKNQSFITRLKIRGTYGTTGNVTFPSYSAISTYKSDSESWYYTGPSYGLVALGNNQLKWETTTISDIGFDMSLLDSKISLRASLYWKETSDLLTSQKLRHSSGFDSYYINSGKIMNKGYELNLNVTFYRNEDWFVAFSGNLARNINEIVELSDVAKESNRRLREEYNAQYSNYKELLSMPVTQYVEGKSRNTIYAVKSLGIDPANGKELFLKKNGTTTYTYDGNDQVEVGCLDPKAMGNFGFNVSYKAFSLNTSFSYSYGSQLYNRTLSSMVENAQIRNENVDKRVIAERWKKPGDVVAFYDIKANRDDAKATSRFVQDNNYVKFNSLKLGYNFDHNLIKKFGVSKMNISLSASNLFNWSTINTEKGRRFPFERTYRCTLNIGI